MTFISNKKVIIIGATSGLGKALAVLYAQAGCAVGITGRRSNLLHELQQQYSPHITTACFDVRGNDNIAHLQALIEQMDGMDLFIYNAGYGDPSDTLDWELDKTTYETNVKGFIELVNFAFNYFLQQGKGHIAATSSIAAYRGNSLAPAYSASKAFMSVYMEGLHIKATKIKAAVAITDIQPGFLATKMAKADKQFWVVPLQKAARQIARGIEKKKWRIYISRRWWLIAQLMKWAPSWLYHKVG
jgi:short-subunit dehydrogenase